MSDPYSGKFTLRDTSGPGPKTARAAFPEDLEPLSAAAVARRLARYVAPHAGWFLASFACAALSVVLQLEVPVLIGRAIDAAVGPHQVDFSSIRQLARTLALVVAAAAVTQWVAGYGTNRLSFKTVRDLRVEAYAKVSRLTVADIDSHPRGDVVARVASDVDMVGDGLLQGLNQLLSGVVTIVGTLYFMFAESPAVALVVVLVTPLSIGASAAIERLSHRSFSDQQSISGELASFVEEHVGNQQLVELFDRAEEAGARFAEINARLYVTGEHAQFVSSLTNPGTRVVNNLTYAAVAVVGCLGLATGWPARLTVGQVQSFLAYANQYMKPFNEISGVVTQVQTSFACARRVFALLDAPEVEPDVPGALALSEVRGALEVEGVTFGYEPGRTILRDVSFAAQPGQTIAIVGPTGGGKTTIMNLLLRFYDPQRGSIRLDGHPIAEVERASLRHAFGMVLQESWIFEGTVADNIAYGRPDATREQVEQAARAARAHEFVRRLPHGYDTVIAEGGGSLSQGQCQLICIARVMLADPAVLLLDEATSSIDTRTEALVQEAFDRLAAGRTSVVVAHRLSTVQAADCILVLRDGAIVERGTHAELLGAGGFYARLFNSQFGNA